MKKYDKPDHCPICFDTLQDNDYLECGHWTHVKCIKKTNKSECAICRTKLNIKIENKVSTFSQDINSLLDISESHEESNDSDEESPVEEEEPFFINVPCPQVQDNSVVSEKKLVIETINHLKYCKQHDYGGYYIDDDIEFFEKMLGDGEYNELGSYSNLKKICGSAIDRAYSNYFCQGSEEDNEESDDEEDYPEEESDECSEDDE